MANRPAVVWLTRLLGVALCGLIAGCSGSAGSLPAKESPAVPEDKSHWPPTFVDLDGHELRPAENTETKAIALVFVLRDCPISNSYMPELNRLHDEFATRGVQMLLVQADSETTAPEAREHAKQYEIKSGVILDPRHEWVKQAGAATSPEAVVFSTAGQIVYRGRIDDQYVGLGKRRAVVTSHDLREALEAIVTGQPVPQPRTEAIGCPIPKTNGE
jgi:redoxin